MKLGNVVSIYLSKKEDISILLSLAAKMLLRMSAGQTGGMQPGPAQVRAGSFCCWKLGNELGFQFVAFTLLILVNIQHFVVLQ